jgi:carboxypeptidase Q
MFSGSRLAFLSLALTLTALAPKPAQAQQIDPSVMARIRDEGLNRSQLPQTLSYLTEVIGPRLTGSPGLMRANEWTKSKLNDWGIEAKLEPWGPFGRGWTCEKFAMQVSSPTAFPIISAPKAWCTGWSGTADVVFLEAATEEDLAKFRGTLKGKIVLISPIRETPAHFTPQGSRYTEEELTQMAEGTPRRRAPQTPGVTQATPNAAMQSRIQQMQFAGRRLAFAKAEGAVAVLDAARGDGGTVFVQQATVPAPLSPPSAREREAAQQNGTPPRRIQPQSQAAEKLMLPQIAVSAEHYNRIARMVQAGEPVRISLDLKVRFNGDDKSMVYNTTGEIKGTDKADEIVMCGAHIDSWQGGTGATDNGCGTAVCLEAMRILKTLKLIPRRTIRIGLWSGEEQGLYGSAGYVKEHFGTMASPKTEHGKFSTYFNLDNGTGKIRGVYCQGNNAILPIFSDWLKPFADLGATTVTVQNTGGTDHLSFNGAGLPGFQFIQDTIEYDSRTHHSNQDVFDRVQLDDMKQAATIMAAFLYNAAMSDEKMPRKPSAN